MIEQPSNDEPGGDSASPVGPPRLALLKALGDNTRYAIYLELARSGRPLSTGDIAASLGLHANTVRPHLERMRDVGLVVVTVEADGSVGRPLHRYGVAPNVPSLGLEPAAYPLLAELLTSVADRAGATSDLARQVGMEMGSARIGTRPDAAATDDGPVHRLLSLLANLGFDPAVHTNDESQTIAFTHCPYRPLAETAPSLICGLHRGLVEGFLSEAGASEVVVEFRTLVDRDPCQMSVAAAPP